MPRLLNFTTNTQFPAVAKKGVNKTTVSQGGRYISAGENYITETVITVPESDILNCCIGINGRNYPVNTFSDITSYSSGTFVKRIEIERSSSTQVIVRMRTKNQTSIGIFSDAWSANVTIHSFSVP